MTQIALSPAEAAKVTGVMPATQRDWRHRRFLSASSDGWTRFDAEGLAELWLLQILAASGKMKDGAEVAKSLAVPLGRYIQARAEGQSPPRPADVAVLWADGTSSIHPSFQDAVNKGSAAQQAGPMTVLMLDALATPLWIRLRGYLQEQGELVQ